jgi:hypothetical protein
MIGKALIALITLAIILLVVYAIGILCVRIFIGVRRMLDEDRQKAIQDKLDAQEILDRLDRKLKVYEGNN